MGAQHPRSARPERLRRADRPRHVQQRRDAAPAALVQPVRLGTVCTSQRLGTVSTLTADVCTLAAIDHV
eukprot:5676587-Prymnesium_polylepis.1